MVTERPTEIRLLGQRIAIEAVPINAQIYGTMHGSHVPTEGATTHLGITEITIQRIAIRDGQGFHQERATVIHEALHAIERLTGHSSEDPSTAEAKERHSTVSAFETGLLDLLRSNPTLVKWLLEAEARP